MKLFSEEVQQTSTSSDHNILRVENFSEIFFDVFEIEINKSKYPVEKISEYEGFPVVSVPVVVEDTEILYPFVLTKGKFDVVFSVENTMDKLYPDKSFDVIKEKVETVIEENPVVVVENLDIEIEELSNKKDLILQKIEEAKENARHSLARYKKRVIAEADKEVIEKHRILEEMLSNAKESMLSEFVLISNKIKDELLVDSNLEYNNLKGSLENKVEGIYEDLREQLSNDFENSSKIFDSKVRDLIKELYLETVSPKVEKELNDIAHQIVKKVGEIETVLDEKLDNKAEISLVEGVSKELEAIQKANIELNDTINKGVNKALSRAGNARTLVEKLDKEIQEKITLELSNIGTYFDERIQNIQEKTFDITEESRKYIIELVNKSKIDLLEEIRKIPKEKPIEYIIEAKKGNPENVNIDKLKKEYDTIIHNKFENYKTDLRKYISVYSGGGSVAVQFQDGGTMNGDLVVTGSISASQYLGISNNSDYLPLSGGTLTGDLSAQTIYSNGNQVAIVSDPVRTTLSGDGVTTVFAISGADGLVNPSALIVAIDGVLQEPTVDYTVAGGNITFTTAVPNGSKAVVISPTNSIQIAQAIPADGSVTSPKLDTNIEIAGQLTVPNQTANSDASAMSRKLVALHQLQYSLSPFQWNTPTGTANTFGALLGDGAAVMVTAGAVAGNHRIATIAYNPFVRGGSGVNMRLNNGRFSLRFSTAIRAFDNNELRLLIGVAAATTSLSAVVGIGLVWVSATLVKLQINNGTLSELPIVIPTCDPSVLQKWILTFDGSTLRLFYLLWGDSTEPPDWTLGGELVGVSLPSVCSGTSINIVNIATGSVTSSVSNNMISSGMYSHQSINF